MVPNRLSDVLSAIAQATQDGIEAADGVCAAAVELLAVTAGGLSLMVDGELRGRAGVTEPVVARIQDLELTLGQGPGVEAWHSGVPVLEPDLGAPSTVRWHAFAQSAAEAGVAAAFAFPLTFGAIRIGVLELYRDRPGRLTDEQIARGVLVADIAAHLILGLQAGAPVGTLHKLLADAPAHWAEVHQATGMVAVQLGVALDEAFARLRARAFADDRPIRLVAADIVARRLRLDGDS